VSKHRQEKRKLGRKPADAHDAPAPAERDQPVAPVGRPQPAPTPPPVAVPRPRPTSTPNPRQQGKPAPAPAVSKPKPARKPAARSGTTYATRPAATYGGSSPAAARALLLVGLTVSGLFLAWLAWAAWFHSTPSVTSQLDSYEVSGDHLAIAVVDVDLDQGVHADCLVQAIAEDHSVVGEVHFTPVDGTNRIEIRTERMATTVQAVGCTSADQSQPR